jgi:hypothetical protein
MNDTVVLLTCLTGDGHMGTWRNRLRRLDLVGRVTLHVINTEPVCNQYRSIFRHHAPVPVRHEENAGPNGHNDCHCVGAVGSDKHTASDRLEAQRTDRPGAVSGQSRYRIPGLYSEIGG